MTISTADNPNIRYTGRVDHSDPRAPSFAFPGVCIEACFEGHEISLLLSDTGDQNYFEVEIDNLPPQVFQSAKGLTTWAVAAHLTSGPHTVRIVKRTEALCGVTTFHGFQLADGARLVAPAAPLGKRLEFIGDSITCGYGNMVSTYHPQDFPFTPANENNSLSWGALTAQALDAQYVAVAYSGRGLMRNFDGTEAGTLPEIYASIFPDTPGKAAWDMAAYCPDVLVINLGTNDYYSQLTRKDLSDEAFDARFADTYRHFLTRLRQHHGPTTRMVCAVGPMLSDDADNRFWSRIQSAVSGVVDNVRSQGDLRVYYLVLSPQEPPFGEDWHPSAATHARMAKTTAEYIRPLL
ncbi:MAG TPA: SGNH/GDSL hydrolase family protein [Rhodoferax sp.]